MMYKSTKSKVELDCRFSKISFGSVLLKFNSFSYVSNLLLYLCVLIDSGERKIRDVGPVNAYCYCQL